MNARKQTILLAHGGGGRLARDLVSGVVVRRLGNDFLAPLADAAVLGRMTGFPAFTTDSYVVRPLFFPGGDIGRLSVCGTVNDLAVMGARPVALSCALIIEEGFALDDLDRILASMRDALDEAGAMVVTGDTKVVERGAADGIFINTAGIGEITGAAPSGARTVRAGDAVIVSGTLGDHGIAVLAQREGLEFGTELKSDCAPLNGLCAAALEAAPRVRFMRDPTRGGLAATLNELASACGLCVEIDQESVPLRPETSAVCELLGLDPLHVANEGKVVVVAPPGEAAAVLSAMKSHRYGTGAAVIGEVSGRYPGRVIVRTPVGGDRVLDLPAGEPLPRIC